MARGWKTRVDGSPAQIGQKYQERERAYPYGARRRASGTVLVPQERSVEAFKKPLTEAEKRKRIEKEFLQIVKRPSFRGRYDAVYLRLCKKYGVDPFKKPLRAPAKPSATGRAYLKKFSTEELKRYREYFVSVCGKEDYERELAARKRAGSPKKPKRAAASIQDTPEYQAGFEQAQREAAMGKYHPHKSKSETWKRGYDAGWKNGMKDPKYDEIVLINTEEDITAWEKRRAVMESEAFQIWLNERYNTQPIPSDPYRAFMIDKSLKAKLKQRPEWAQRTNVADWQPVDYPPITKEPVPDITEPAPRTVRAEETKKMLRKRSTFLAKEMGIPEPKLRFTVAQLGRARSFYRSGFARNRFTGEIVRVQDPEIVIGIPRSGKIYPENYATLSHEMGHHKTVVEMERKGGTEAVSKHYLQINRYRAARIQSEREAWQNADPYMKDHRPAQKWLKKYAFGTYVGTTPGFKPD